ncbi:MAG TPA: hypothetical protein VD713_05230, partial [Sphingomonadales bacterium]|nr:hypothetical protein [Sphingomonadales bacterium]
AELVLEDNDGLRFGVPARALGADAREAVFTAPVKGPVPAGAPQAVTALLSDGWGNALEKRLDIDFNSKETEKTP